MPDQMPHLTPDELDLLLDASLPSPRMSHLETCEECRTALEETREVVAQLRRLPLASPGVAFADRVVAEVGRAKALAEHLSPEDLDLWVTGTLPAAREGHLRACPECQTLANQERLLVLRLEALPLFDPAPGLADRVLDEVDIPVTSLLGAMRLWRRRLDRRPEAVVAASAVAVVLGGSLAASAAWAAGNQEVITGMGQWALGYGERWFWVLVGTLEAQGWYQALRDAFTPGRAILAATGLSALYAGGVLMLRRLIALPEGTAARAAS
jgi:hypothetical protein